MQADAGSPQRGPLLGVLSLILGLLACTGVAVIWLLSTTDLDLPGWLRILSGWSFPVGVLGAIGCGVAARMRRSGAGLSIAGFILAGVSVIAFVVMLVANPY